MPHRRSAKPSQVYNNSLGHSCRVREEYRFNLSSTAALELSINPDISLGEARASLRRLQLAVGI